DYASTEKIGGLPKKLSTLEVPAGYDPKTSDIAYDAPRGNLSIFYRDFRHSAGLVRPGRIGGSGEALDRVCRELNEHEKGKPRDEKWAAAPEASDPVWPARQRGRRLCVSPAAKVWRAA
ncbi:MAG: hypothetical protein LBU46_04170, partial [Candidatus Accumulibacter sp.]|nr:hypothetical protein [Accumulibacter sp.]